MTGTCPDCRRPFATGPIQAGNEHMECRRRMAGRKAHFEIKECMQSTIARLRSSVAELDTALAVERRLFNDECSAHQATTLLLKSAESAREGAWAPKIGSVWLESERNLESTVKALSPELGVRVERFIDGRATRCWFGLSVFWKLFVPLPAPPTPEGE